MPKKLVSALAALVLATSLGSCYALDHRVGSGAQGGAKAEERQWYFLFGLVPLNDVDSHALAGDAKNYDVRSEYGVVDLLLNLITGWVTIYSQTVTVTK
jgi:Bor protein